MKVQSDIDIGFRALTCLGCQEADSPLSSAAIATEIGVHASQVTKVLVALRASGYVVSIRGIKGGYKLNRAPSAINLAGLYQHLQGDKPFLPHGEGPHSPFLGQAYTAFTGSLLDHSLADVIAHAKATERRNFVGAA